jgi:hypothetical protein
MEAAEMVGTKAGAKAGAKAAAETEAERAERVGATVARIPADSD